MSNPCNIKIHAVTSRSALRYKKSTICHNSFGIEVEGSSWVIVLDPSGDIRLCKYKPYTGFNVLLFCAKLVPSLLLPSDEWPKRIFDLAC